MSTQHERDIHLIATPFRFVAEWIKILIFILCLPFVFVAAIIHHLHTGKPLWNRDILELASWALVILSPWIAIFAYGFYELWWDVLHKRGTDTEKFRAIPMWGIFFGTIPIVITVVKCKFYFGLDLAWLVETVWTILLLSPFAFLASLVVLSALDN